MNSRGEVVHREKRGECFHYSNGNALSSPGSDVSVYGQECNHELPKPRCEMEQLIKNRKIPVIIGKFDIKQRTTINLTDF
jgi:hypothetical protein